MILHLSESRHVSVESHSGKIWISSYNGCGTVNPMSPEEAAEFGLSVWRKARKLMREQPKVPLTSIP